MKTLFRFEKLEVWQDARRRNRQVYKATKAFPSDEQFALTSQLRRASISVSSNIAEGSGRNSDKDFAHFLEQAYGSLMEVASQLYLAFDEGYIEENPLSFILEEIRHQAAKVAALNRSLSVKGSKVRISRASGPSTFDVRRSTK
jgi:four helix bundle protein